MLGDLKKGEKFFIEEVPNTLSYCEGCGCYFMNAACSKAEEHSGKLRKIEPGMLGINKK